MSLRDTIRGRFDELSPALQQAARFVLDRPTEVVTGSMRSVSAASGIAPSNLLRFAQSLGYDGWPALKADVVHEMGLGASHPYGERAQSLVKRGKDKRLAAELFAAQRANLDATERQAGDLLPKAAGMLAKAGHVHVAGFRACFPVAYSFVYLYRLFRDSVSLLDGMGGSLEMQARAIRSQDALLVVSFAPYSREALDCARAARAAGAKVIALTDSAASPLSLIADETIVFATQSPSFFPSVTAALAVGEALIEALLSLAGEGVVKRLTKAEMQLFESGAYLQPPSRR
jgi:DNA-binding MurR/RpiR family transcriptional regulator